MEYKTQCSKLAPLLTNKELWTVLKEYLAEERDSLVSRLMNCSKEDLPKIQGELQGVNKLYHMHDNLQAEKGKPKR